MICSPHKPENITLLCLSRARQCRQEECLCLAGCVGRTSASQSVVLGPVVSASPSLLVICCCETGYPKISGFNHDNLSLFLTVSVGQEFLSGSAGKLWLRVSHEVVVKVSSAGSTGTGAPASKVAPLSQAVKFVLGVGSKTRFLSRLLECPQDMRLGLPCGLSAGHRSCRAS